MSDRKGTDIIEGRWEDIVADVHRFDGKTVRVSVVEEEAPLQPEEWTRRFSAWLEEVRANPIGPATPIPSKAERREIFGKMLEEREQKRKVRRDPL